MNIPCQIKTKDVFEYFVEICSIPHGSGNTKQISDFCIEFAIRHGLKYRQDEYNNVIISKPASPGYSAHPNVILQGHLDMVCEKQSGCDIDFKNEGLRLRCDGTYIFADETTLGADDGIAVAMILAILADKAAVHPPLTAVFTTDEEVGMTGAANIDLTDIKSKILINIDSEEEGILTVSCAGGSKCEISIPVKYTSCKNNVFDICVSGLMGGHSGTEINSGRFNANVLMAGLLAFLKEKHNIRVCCVNGGSKDNAIARECSASIEIDSDMDTVCSFCKSYFSGIDLKNEKDFNFKVSESNKINSFDDKTSNCVIGFLSSVPNGVIKMNDNLKDLVQTSLNLGRVRCKDNKLYAVVSVRSSVDEEKEELVFRLREIADKFCATMKVSGEYPAWEYKHESRLRNIMTRVYENMFFVKPQIKAIHAGLECGLLCGKINGLDAVSFGPDILDIHTPQERLDIKSVERMYDYLINVLKEL